MSGSAGKVYVDGVDVVSLTADLVSLTAEVSALRVAHTNLTVEVASVRQVAAGEVATLRAEFQTAISSLCGNLDTNLDHP